MEKLETSRVIIDTDILVDMLRENEEATAFVSRIENKGYVLATTAVNAFELYHGAHKADRPEEALRLTNELLRNLVLIPFTPRAARKAGHINATLERKGELIGTRDVFIAAIALTKGYGVATRNLQHFRKIPDLQILNVDKL
jgi:tRNA(fMet)-specific endonuclease VapC